MLTRANDRRTHAATTEEDDGIGRGRESVIPTTTKRKRDARLYMFSLRARPQIYVVGFLSPPSWTTDGSRATDVSARNFLRPSFALEDSVFISFRRSGFAQFSLRHSFRRWSCSFFFTSSSVQLHTLPFSSPSTRR